MLTNDKAKMAAIARDLETVLQEMAAMREETRALTATLTRVAEKVEAIAPVRARPRMDRPVAILPCLNQCSRSRFRPTATDASLRTS